MRAAANKPNINIVAVNDPFISVDYSEYILYFDTTSLHFYISLTHV